MTYQRIVVQLVDPDMGEFEAELTNMLRMFDRDPSDAEFTRGYKAALLDFRQMVQRKMGML